MNSRDYWHDREIEALQHYITDEKEYSRHIEKIYMDMLDNVQKEISSFYGKYAAAEGISIAEAKKKISKADMDALARDAERYTKAAARDRKLNGGQTDYTAGYFSKEANDRMRLYNATMKINRLEMLKANIGRHLIKGSAELDEYMGEILQGRTVEELERQAGILGESVKDNAKAAHSIVNASFHNATFSNRIWLYNDVMKADIDKLIQQGMIQGKNARVLAKDLRKYYTGSPKLKNGKNGAIYSAERLMRTELARVQIGAQEKALKANGFDMYQFNVNGGCCPDCEQAAKKDNGYGPGVYLLEDLQYGYNAPPLHPHCRCSISAYSDRKVYDAWFDYMDKTGQEISWQDFYKQQRQKTVVDTAKIIEKMRSKDIWQGLPDEKRDAILDAIKNGDIELLKAAEQCMENCSVNWDGDSSYYRKGTGRITIGDIDTDIALARTFWHEFGHFMDDSEISKSGFGYTYRYKNGSSFYSPGVTVIVDECGYKYSAYKDLKQMLKKLGLDDKYDVKAPSEYENQWIIKKLSGEVIDTSADFDEMLELENALSKYFKERSGMNKANNYVYDMGYPKQPKWDDYFETYTTPKRQTVKTRPRYKGAENDWAEALEANAAAREKFEASHNMDALYKEQERLIKQAQENLDLFGAVSDTFDGLSYGAFQSSVMLGGHSPTYYQTNFGNMKEAVANVYQQMLFGNSEVEQMFKDVCPETYKLIKESWKYNEN